MDTHATNVRPWNAMRQRLVRGLAVALLAAAPILHTAVAGPAAGGAREHDIKAAFLFRFLQLIEWPDASFASTNSPIVVGLLKPEPFGNVLDRALRNERIGNRPIQIRRGNTPDELLPCHLLFVPRDAGSDLRGLAPGALQGVLTVGEAPGFLDAGGMINFFMHGNQVRFEINPEAAYDAGIRMRSRLLRLGRLEGQAQPNASASDSPSP